MSLGDIMRKKLEQEAAEQSAARAAEEAKEEAEKAEQATLVAQSGCKHKDEPHFAHSLLHARDHVESILDEIVHGAKHEMPGDIEFDRSMLIDDLRSIRDRLDAAANKARAISAALDTRQKKLEEKPDESKCDDHTHDPGH